MAITRMLILRKRAGLSQTRLANLVGLSQSMISQIETGCKKPSREALYRIACALRFEGVPERLLDEIIDA